MKTIVKIAAGLMASGAAVAAVAVGGQTQKKSFAASVVSNKPASLKAKKAVGAAQPYKWQSVPIVGGGFVSGIIFHPRAKNVVYARTDIGGAYRWDARESHWIPLTDWVTSDTWNYTGIESIGLDPADPKRVYLAAGTYTNDWAGNGAIFRSTDQGATWQKTDLPFKLGGNEEGRFAGERLVVDPNNGAILFFGTRKNGLWKSTDYGATWAQVKSFPTAAAPSGVGIGRVLFDGRTGKKGAATQILYAGVSDKTAPLYRSRDGGATWEAVPNSPTGLLVNHIVTDASGVLYLTYGDAMGPNGMMAGAIYKCDTQSGVWTNITPEKGTFGYGGITLDAQHAGTLLATTMDRWAQKDEVFRSRNGGATWEAIGQKSKRDVALAPWLTWGRPDADVGHWMGDVEIDPFDSNHALYVTGTGIWTTHDLTNADTPGQTALWTVGAAGLEECVVNNVVSPPSGAPLLSVVWDIDGFRHNDLNVSPPAGFFKPDHGHNWDIDFAENDPNNMARTFVGGTHGAVSTDNGKTWKDFPSSPPNSERGQTKIAVSADGKTLVFSATDAGGASLTRDNGATWTQSKGLPSEKPVRVVSDRSDSNRFYAFDNASGVLYASSNGGETFAPVGVPVAVGGDGYLRAAPGKVGDLWIASRKGIFHSQNNGADFVRVSGIESARRIGFGKAAPNHESPAVYVNGTKDNAYGFYRSDDEGATWTRINDDAHQFGGINAITGDGRVYGRVYVASQNRGILRGDLPDAGQ